MIEKLPIAFVAILIAIMPITGAVSVINEEATFLNNTYIRSAILNMPVTPLSEEEQNGILYMREEEKLARDVYLELYDQIKMPIFWNIAGAEQTHMDSVKLLIDRYGLVDTATDEVGSFTNEELQALYDNLIEMGSTSLEDALKVGATIEELDILDLEIRTAETEKEDIIQVYASLMKGSRNHLRSFVRTLERQGFDYSPQYLSQEEFDMIVTSSMETGPY